MRNIKKTDFELIHYHIKHNNKDFIFEFRGYTKENMVPLFEVLIDNVSIKYNIHALNSKEFLVESHTFRKFKTIAIVSRDIKSEIVFEKSFSYFEIKKTKLLSLVRRLVLFSLRFLNLLIKAVKNAPKIVRLLWKRHKFIVPINMWSQYYKVLKIRFKHNGESPFFNPQIIGDYQQWLNFNNNNIEEISELLYNPRISILIPVYNVNPKYLRQCVDSVLNQSYDNIELCIVDDASSNLETLELLRVIELEQNRNVKIKYRQENGHICRATNDCLSLATGDYIGLLDNDDLLDKNACLEVVKVLNNNKAIDFIYTDEDKIDDEGRFQSPHFKPDYSPDTLRSLNYISHFTVIRKSIVNKVGGFRVGFEGSQDYDLYLRVLEETNNIHHISKVLYHWRIIEGSTSQNIESKSYAIHKGKLVIEDHLSRTGKRATVHVDPVSRYYFVEYLVDPEPLVSIIIPTKDNYEILEQCLESIYNKSVYRNFEVLVINNNSSQVKTFQVFSKFSKKFSNFKIIDLNMEFNYSKLNNLAVRQSNGEYILLLNNDTKVISENWLNYMVGYAMQKHIGAVGTKLLYADDTVQHCGIVLGIGGVGSHVFLNTPRVETGLFGRLSVPYNYTAVTGACLLVSRSNFDLVGGLDENLMVAYNDVDFCIKLTEKGFKNIVLPNALLYHLESKSRGYDNTIEKFTRFKRESMYMYEKWRNLIENDPMYNSNYSLNGWFVLDKNIEK